MTITTQDDLRLAMAASVRDPKWKPKNGVKQWDSFGGSKPRINHALVIKFVAEGYSHRAVASVMNCAPCTVEGILRSHRLREARA